VTDKFLTPGQIKCFENFFNYLDSELFFNKIVAEEESVQFDIKNSSFDYSLDQIGLIVKEPSEKLFGYERLVWLKPVESIKPDAQFLFANMKDIGLVSNNEIGQLEGIADIIDQRERINISHANIDSIELRLNDLEDKSKDLDELAKYPIRKLHLKPQKIKLNTLYRIKNHFNYLTQLNVYFSRFDRLDHTAFEFCAPTLVELNLYHISAKSIENGLLKLLVNLKKLVINLCNLEEVDFDSDFVAGLENLTYLELYQNIFRSISAESFKSLVNR
jgi:hypothetical protein